MRPRVYMLLFSVAMLTLFYLINVAIATYLMTAPASFPVRVTAAGGGFDWGPGWNTP